MKKNLTETFLWLLFMVAATFHVYVELEYLGTKLEWALILTLTVGIFNCGVLCGWKLAWGGEFVEVEEVPDRFSQPKREQQTVVQRERPVSRGVKRAILGGREDDYEESYYEDDDGLGYDYEYEEQMRNPAPRQPRYPVRQQKSRVRQRPPQPHRRPSPMTRH